MLEPIAATALLCFSATVFLSAFLLFQVQPLLGRFILPWFGSAPGVWATCMVFFQALLLLGYAYAHVVVNRWSARRQALVHGGLLILAVLTLPITPNAAWKPTDANSPTWRILSILTMSVGAPYLLLAATSPLLQGWFARLAPGRPPYRLYALSNVGSMLGLLSYPFLVEPHLFLKMQTLLWSVSFGLFVLLSVCCAWFLAKRAPAFELQPQPLPQVSPPAASAHALQASTSLAQPSRHGPPQAVDYLLWGSLAACGSVLLLATTNQLCLDVAVIPFLWVLPLSLYLLSFVLCFDHDRWYVRPLFCALLPIMLIEAVRLLEGGIDLGIRHQVVGYAAVLFVGCMCCHGEMARLRPEPRHLTAFFLTLSIGGVAGGLFVAVLSPAAFSGFHEFPLALITCYALIAGVVLRQIRQRDVFKIHASLRQIPALAAWAACLLAILIGIVATLIPSNWVGSGLEATVQERFERWQHGMVWAMGIAVGLPLLIGALLDHRKKSRPVGWKFHAPLWTAVGPLVCSGGVCLAGALIWLPQPEEMLHVVQDRNFYGVLAIKEYNDGGYPRWGLKHGRIRHGIQLKGHRDWPTSYYGPTGGAGIALRFHPARLEAGHQFRVGVVGLGAGTLAAYANASVDPGRPGYVRPEHPDPPDYMRFYELNPMVLKWAEEKFSFVPDARRRGADVKTLLGDARIVLERQLAAGEAQDFDVLAIDAFSGDAIPIHLLTKESLDIYWGHLKQDGILAFHVSNRYVHLEPVIQRLASEFGVQLLCVESDEQEALAIDPSEWLLMTRNESFLADPRVRANACELPPPGPLWTDEFSSVFHLLKLGR